MNHRSAPTGGRHRHRMFRRSPRPLALRSAWREQHSHRYWPARGRARDREARESVAVIEGAA